jgi:hypothetical protein
MAETQRVTSSSASSRPALKPRLRHPPRHNPPPRMAAPPPTPPKPAVAATAPSAPEVPHVAPRLRRRPLPPRTPAEWVVLAVLLCGLGLNVIALLTASRLSRSDLLLGATVLLAGIVLLILIELSRRSAPCAVDED